MKKHWKKIAIILPAAAILSFFLQSLMRESIVEPLLYLVWIGQLIFLSIPQVTLWALFLLIIVVVALGSLHKKEPPPPRVPPPDTGRVERIGKWTTALQRADEDFYYQWQLAQKLQRLTVEALANNERVDPYEIRQRLERGTDKIPPDILTYLQAGMTSFSHFAGNKKSRLRFGLKKQASPLDLDPEHVIQFLEDTLEHHTN